MQDKSLAELFLIVRDDLPPHNPEFSDPKESVQALNELERRTAVNLLERLERVTEDIKAFRDSHSSGLPPLDAWQSALYRAHMRGQEPVHPDGVTWTQRPDQVPSMLAEQRAWTAIEAWQFNNGDLSVTILRTSEGTWYAVLTGREETRKQGTSRLDALAHLAAWCTEDMQPKTGTPSEYGMHGRDE